MCVRPSLQCAMQIEIPYYGLDVGRADKCSHSGGNDAVVSQELTQRFKIMLPMCNPCLDIGKETFTQRPYRKGQKWFFVSKCNFINGYVTPNHFYISHSFMEFILTLKSWVILFPKVIPQKPFNVDFYQFSKKMKKFWFGKNEKYIQNKMKSRTTDSVFLLCYGNHISFFWPYLISENASNHLKNLILQNFRRLFIYSHKSKIFWR